MTATPLLSLSGVGKRYGDIAALENVDLDVDAGTFVALVGASGSGKTTLLKTVNRLIRTDSGTARISGKAVADFAAPELRRSIGYVFQKTGLFPHMTVEENIAIVQRLSGVARAARAARVTELLGLVDLPRALARRYPHELSGGQAQRVGVARALAASPAVMLMDEPFGALDPVTRNALGEAYRALHERLGLTTLMVTHDVSEALLLADRIVVLRHGRICADAAPQQLLTGEWDATVADMIAVPRAQAERLSQMARKP